MTPVPTNCPIREHTGDGAFVGRCDFALDGMYCPRHGHIEDYGSYDDREVKVEERRHKPDLWHRPKPGPLYWDFRCMVCSEPVADHPSWWKRLRKRFS